MSQVPNSHYMGNRKYLSSKSGQLRGSAIDEIARLCFKYDAVDLALGAPDLETPDEVREAAIEAIRNGNNRYTDSWGAESLRVAIAEKFARYQRVETDPETEITVTCGATEAMFNAMMAITDPGDEVILFEPFFDNYIPAIEVNGAVVRCVKLRRPDWHFDEQELRNAFGYRTKAIIINTPSNPTGKVFSRQELQLIAELCRKWDALCVTDEIYEHIAFDGLHHYSMLQIEDMRERTIIIGGLSKTYGMTGWRIGYVIAPKEISDSIRSIHSFITYCAPAPMQAACIAALQMPDDYYKKLCSDMQKRRDQLISTIERYGFIVYRPQGSFYLMANISNFGFASDVEFCLHMIKNIGVACVPGSSFYQDQKEGSDVVRFCFGKAINALSAAKQRLSQLANGTRDS